MMSNYQKLDDFDLYCVKKHIFIQIRNNLIFIKKSPWTPMFHLSPVCKGRLYSDPKVFYHKSNSIFHIRVSLWNAFCRFFFGNEYVTHVAAQKRRVGVIKKALFFDQHSKLELMHLQSLRFSCQVSVTSFQEPKYASCYKQWVLYTVDTI